MKNHFRAAALLAGFCLPLLARGQQLPVRENPSPEPGRMQEKAPQAPPEITPPPAATPMPSPLPPPASGSPAPSAPQAVPTAVPRKPVDTRTLLNSLSQADVQEAIGLLKSNYLDPAALNETELARATLQGLLMRLSPGVSLLPGAGSEAEEPSPFRSEALDSRVGYIRLGSISKTDLDQMDAALQGFSDKSIKAAILDLRATPASSDFATAARIIMRFVARGKLLFTLTKPGAKEEQAFNSDEDPRFQGLLVVLVDARTAGASEVIAAVLRLRADSLVVGEQTRGEAVEFASLPLRNGQVLRVGVGNVVLPENKVIYPQGVKPDLAVAVNESTEEDALNQELEKGAAPFVFELERPRRNEASLVAGTDPELDALQAAQHSKERPKPPLRDVILQRGMDVITSISIYTQDASK